MTTQLDLHITPRFFSFSLLIMMIFVSLFLRADNLKRIIDLEGRWKFTVGDDPAWSAVDYNDKDWDYVAVPGNWENEGFEDYNGFAWYRKQFILNINQEEMFPFLILGYIDDVEEVYLNGNLIGGTGIMPPVVGTAHKVLRKYPLPIDLLNKNGENVIAVRVFDEYREGGIYAGPVGIYNDQDNELLSLNLAGYWDFEALLNNEDTSDRFYNQKNGKIYVPGYWESFGYPMFDGKAVYSTSFTLAASFDDTEILIVLGYIDDIDKVYLNGEQVGTVETSENDRDNNMPYNLIFRAYKIPPGLLKKGGMNSLEVKVYDTGGLGGIYEGPVGLISAENFELLDKTQEEKPYNIWEDFLKGIFEWD